MFWIALGSEPSPQTPNTWWAFEFTPRVCWLDGCLLLEVQASLRLFGGVFALLQRVQHAAKAHGWTGMATAPTAHGAWGLLQGPSQGGHATLGTLTTQLDALPTHCLMVARPHQATLSGMGCHTLGQLRRLPRQGLVQRFGAPLQQALDQAYGQQVESFHWISLPDAFDLTHELPGRVDAAPDLMQVVALLLKHLETWLQARQAGATRLTLTCLHDSLRHGGRKPQTLELQTAQPTRNLAHWCRLFQEKLALTALVAPAVGLRLCVQDTFPLPTTSCSWLPDPHQAGTHLTHCMERLAARLGADNIRQPHRHASHCMEAMQQWRSSGMTPKPWSTPGHAALQPPWLLPEPLALTVAQDRPHYHGALTLLTRPWRLESDWWNTAVQRDYFVAESPRAGLVCVYREHARHHHLAKTDSWFLQGFYG